MIRSLGAGSGLDLDGIVQQLLAIESQPLAAIQARQQAVQADISTYGLVKGAVSALQDAARALATADRFDVFTAQSADEDIYTASAASSAAPGSYAIEVVRLAEAHKMTSDAFADSDSFGGASGDSLTIQVGTSATDTLTVDLSSAKTLAQIRDAINADSGNPGVTATLITGDGGQQKLSLTADASGEDNALTLSYGGSITASTFNFATVNSAVVAAGGDLAKLDAELKVDGFTVTRAGNSISDVIEGVTLSLVGTSPSGQTTALTVGRDSAAITGRVQDFVKAYNDLQDTLATARGAGLQGESTLLGLESRTRSLLNTPPAGLAGGFRYLGDIGITLDREGVMSVDTGALEAALNSDFEGVTALFSDDDQGFAFRLDGLLEGYLASGGLLDTRTEGLNSELDRLDDRTAALQRRLEQVERRIRDQFAALDSLVSSLQTTSSFLAQQLGNLGTNNG